VIIIQSATPYDIPTLRALARRIWHAYYPGIISREQIDYMLARMYAAKTLRRELSEGVAWDLVRRQTEPVGFIACSFDTASRRVKLDKLYLLPEWHGHGIGRQMLQHIQARSAELGALEIWLQVNKQNIRAIRAYERAGFSVRDSVVTDIGGSFVMDDFIMVLRLS
jgi:ribosomal protein S18 acetylase RimI-like enzyme